ncbi:MAG: hypothetical protein H0V18_14005 [Pyrinomonadaceae bacterium]|nr:hypothetical protein [Pyrinomonadaceae bacterium]
MKTLRPVLLALSTLLAVVTTRATTVIPPSFDELVGQAEVIFEGTVTDVKSQWVGEGGQRHIVSFVTLKVEDAIKGAPGLTYTVRMLGGTVGDETMKVSDSPEFKVGDRDILFVEHNGTQFIPLVGIMHGRFRLERDRATGKDLVKTNKGQAVTDLDALGKDDHEGAASRGNATQNPNIAAAAVDAGSFKSAIRARLAANTQ